jgi:hypothetical protein
MNQFRFLANSKVETSELVHPLKLRQGNMECTEHTPSYTFERKDLTPCSHSGSSPFWR